MFKPQKTLVVPDWKQDKISLIQFPRNRIIPSASPFSLKLETWLRFNKGHLNYTNVSNEFTKASSKGQLPFIEMNGRQIADSNFIIEHLKGAYPVSTDRSLNSKERADERAYHVLIEESLFRCLMYHRSRDYKWLATDDGALPHLTGVKKILFQKILLPQLQKKLKQTCQAQGIGRHSPVEVDEIAKRDLSALSAFLGNNHYFLGNKPSTLDATAFGHLAQLYWTPLVGSEIKSFIDQSTPNLVQFLERVKREYWPDWNVLCENLLMNANDPVAPQHQQA